MAAASYVASASLTGGVLDGDPVDLDFSCTSIDRGAKWEGSRNIARGGSQETMTDRVDFTWQVGTMPLQEPAFDQLRMFIDSVMDGQEFTFDPYGTIAVPVDPKTVVLSSTNYTERRVQVDYFSLSFAVREV